MDNLGSLKIFKNKLHSGSWSTEIVGEGKEAGTTVQTGRFTLTIHH